MPRGRSDPPPFNTGYVMRTRIRNRRHRVTLGFDERSAGFIWFFSFLVWLSHIRRDHGTEYVILLDEPGLGLHARAQMDMMRFIREKLLPAYQVIYTTHSPFMIDGQHLDGLRTVEDTSDGRHRARHEGRRPLAQHRPRHPVPDPRRPGLRRGAGASSPGRRRCWWTGRATCST